jgi:site-specific DNA recombinase
MTTSEVLDMRAGEVSAADKTAVIYLRVSSTGQLTGHNPEGYSIEGQRAACEHYAASLGARVIGEYVEPGRTATTRRRRALQQMLGELEEVRPTFVIFYDLSRAVREEYDAFWLLAEIKRFGARLMSTREPVDDSPQGLLMFAVMAGVNAFRSRDDGEKVKLGMDRKFADGGTNGPARIGYLNFRDFIEGREIRTVVLDPERAPLVRLGFDTFAVGNYSITAVQELLEEAGLRTLQTPKRAPGPLSRAAVHRMLRSDYYIGFVTWKGAKVTGRHEPLIDAGTFQKVQEVLDAHRQKGSRRRKYDHYLRGSVYCGTCGRRLIFSRVRGNGGQYEYLGCISRPGRGETCDARHLPVGDVEQAVERYHAHFRLSPGQEDAIRCEMERHAGALAEHAGKEAERHARRLQELQRQQQKLLHAHYDGHVDGEVLAAEQARIRDERATAQKWASAAAQDGDEIVEALDEALRLLDSAASLYFQATPYVRRLLNHALFVALYVVDEEIGYADPVPWVAALQVLGRSAEARPVSRPRQAVSCNSDPAFAGHGLNKDKMVRRVGFEPTHPFGQGLLRAPRLPFRHRRTGAPEV